MEQTPPFRVNNRLIDQSHEDLLRLLADADKAVSRAQLFSLIIDIYKHSVVHFLEEELFMKDRGMPEDYRNFHADAHADLKKQIRDVILTMDGYDMAQLRDSLNDLRVKMMDHIYRVDAVMTDHL